MEQPEVVQSPTTEVERLVQRALAHLEMKGYGQETVGRKRRAWEAFAQAASDRSFSAEIAHEFLTERGILEEASGPSLTNNQRETRTAMRQLTEFELYGFFERRVTSPDISNLSAPFDEIRAGYVAFCRDRLGLRRAAFVAPLPVHAWSRRRGPAGSGPDRARAARRTHSGPVAARRGRSAPRRR